MSDIKFTNWLKGYYIDPKYLSLYRIIYCFIVILFAGLPAYTWIGHAPDYLFTPPPISLANLVSEFPEALFFQVITVCGLVSFFLMALGVSTKLTSSLFAFFCIVGHSFWYSFGQIDHTLLWFLAPIVLSQAGWGDYYSYDSLKNPQIDTRFSEERIVTVSLWVFLLAATIGFSMFTAGLQKVMGGWMGLETNASRYHLLSTYYSQEKEKLLGLYFVKINSFFFWKIMDYLTIFLEIMFLFSIINARLFRWFVVGGVLFHLIVLIMLNITFLSNLLVYLLFIDWKSFKWVRRLESLKLKAISRKVYRGIAGFYGIVFVFWLFVALTKPDFKFMPGLVGTIFTSSGSGVPDIVLHIFYALYTAGLVYVVQNFISGQMIRRKL